FESFESFINICFCNNDTHTYSHVKNSVHFVWSNPSYFLQKGKNRWYFPASFLYFHTESSRQHSRKILIKSSTCHMCNTTNCHFFLYSCNRFCIYFCWGKKNLS